tara:strand:- start:71 stop:391 length:321 start_codon:yes stop_codon:yes gene_type:complete
VTNQENKSCWNCGYRKSKQMSEIGVCLYFLHIEKPAKKIPSNIADKGCKYYFESSESEHGKNILSEVIETFNGEYIKEKQRRYYNRPTYKKTYKDNRHKYGKRKDW